MKNFHPRTIRSAYTLKSVASERVLCYRLLTVNVKGVGSVRRRWTSQFPKGFWTVVTYDTCFTTLYFSRLERIRDLRLPSKNPSSTSRLRQVQPWGLHQGNPTICVIVLDVMKGVFTFQRHSLAINTKEIEGIFWVSFCKMYSLARIEPGSHE